jgi:hypothetical protein
VYTNRAKNKYLTLIIVAALLLMSDAAMFKMDNSFFYPISPFWVTLKMHNGRRALSLVTPVIQAPTLLMKSTAVDRYFIGTLYNMPFGRFFQLPRCFLCAPFPNSVSISIQNLNDGN